MANYALVMKTHFWDDFAQRQLDRLIRNCRSADVYVLVDETNGPVSGISHDKIVRFTLAQLTEGGLVDHATEGSAIWWNGDYPMYAFLAQQTGHDHYLFVEFDVCATMSIDHLVDTAIRHQVDHVSCLPAGPIESWYWAALHQKVYEFSRLRRTLFCICYLSRPALHYLLLRRLAMAAAFAAGELPMWPFCEAFIATELAAGGFHMKDLSEFADTSHYDWWPPYPESQIADLPPAAIVHPLLDERRYVQSILKYRPMSFFRPGSLVNRRLRGMPPKTYLPALSSKIVAALQRRVFAWRQA